MAASSSSSPASAVSAHDRRGDVRVGNGDVQGDDLLDGHAYAVDDACVHGLGQSIAVFDHHGNEGIQDETSRIAVGNAAHRCAVGEVAPIDVPFARFLLGKHHLEMLLRERYILGAAGGQQQFGDGGVMPEESRHAVSIGATGSGAHGPVHPACAVLDSYRVDGDVLYRSRGVEMQLEALYRRGVRTGDLGDAVCRFALQRIDALPNRVFVAVRLKD